jgi:hypothetical protein
LIPYVEKLSAVKFRDEVELGEYENVEYATALGRF